VREILHRGEDTARNYVALDLGEPDLYLVKPAGVRRSVMDPNGRIGFQEFENGFGLMCTQIIGNDVDLATGWLSSNDLGKEIDKLHTGVACAGFSKNLSRLRIQGGIERKGSMAIVLEAMPFGSPWREWQNRVQAIKRLDGTLFEKPHSQRFVRVLKEPSWPRISLDVDMCFQASCSNRLETFQFKVQSLMRSRELGELPKR
jgi:hypothetical protein